MPTIVNLNKVRKTKAKQHQATKAAENRVIYGLSAQARKVEKLKTAKASEKLSGNALTSTPDNKKS